MKKSCHERVYNLTDIPAKSFSVKHFCVAFVKIVYFSKYLLVMFPTYKNSDRKFQLSVLLVILFDF